MEEVDGKVVSKRTIHIKAVTHSTHLLVVVGLLAGKYRTVFLKVNMAEAIIIMVLLENKCA